MRRLTIVFALLCGLGACSGSARYLGLDNKGILPLSGSDAFLGSNLFLAREMEQDIYLYNFIKERGAPTAIEIENHMRGEPRMLLYYAPEHALYIAQWLHQGDQHHWIARGPYQIQWKEGKRLQAVARNMQGDPVFFMEGRYQRFPESGAAQPQRIVPVFVPPPPRPAATPRRRHVAPVIVRSEPPVAAAPDSPALNPKDFQKLNTDQRALLISQGYAPRTENGDVLHIVKRENESLAAISRWYTKSDKNAAQIAAANGIPADGPLKQGTQLRVPLGLVQNEKAMPSDSR